jgi:MoxR-like ATPase
MSTVKGNAAVESGVTLRPKQLAVALAACFAAHLPVLLKGAPGIGKTDIVYQGAEAVQHDLIVSHPVTADPTDAKGLPWKIEGRDAATFLPFGDLERAMKATKPTVWFLDDLGQAAPSVQASFMQLILSRHIGEHRIPDHITFAAATNRRSDKAGVSGILEPVKSRFVSILELAPNAEDWSEWALDHNMPPELIAYIRNVKPEALLQFTATADIVNSPSPRTWAHVGQLLAASDKAGISHSDDVFFALLVGAVGEAAATEFRAFLKIAADAPSVDEILKNPKTATIPEELSALYAVSSALAHRADDKNFGAISTYVQRMYAAEHGEMCAFLLRDAVRKTRSITQTPAFSQLSKTPVSSLIFEALGIK